MAKPYCYIDVDLTLVDLNHDLLPYVKQELPRLHQKYTLIAWSAGGEDYARTILNRHGLLPYFQAVLSKPQIIIDDDPGHLLEKCRIVRIKRKTDWHQLWDKIFGKDTAKWT